MVRYAEIRGATVQRESTWTRRLCAEMEAQGAFVLPIVGSAMQRAGMPDRYVAFKLGEGRHFSGWLEFKGATTRVRPLQDAMMRKLQSHGAHVYIVRLGGGVMRPSVNDVCDVPLLQFDDTGYGLMVALLQCG